MKIESPSDLELVLTTAFPDETEREEAKRILSRYGEESFHREIPRVRAACIKVAEEKIEGLNRSVEIACCDYRDILCMAEYPKHSGRFGLKDKNPEKYQKMVDEDLKQYSDWVTKMKGSNNKECN